MKKLTKSFFELIFTKKFSFSVLLICLVLSFIACGSGGDGDGDDAVITYEIGDTGPGGGKVFYVNPNAAVDGWTYLEAAPENATASAIWWSSTSVDVTGAVGIAVGTGKTNTAAIIAAHPGDTAANNAAWACFGYRGPKGKTDWFLPSKDELNELYKARSFLGITLVWYWSSSQRGSDNLRAWLQDFNHGGQDGGPKSYDYPVRAVRAF